MQFQSWESLPVETATFTSDITPLILAAHRDNYEIIKILLDRGSTLPMPHDVRYVAAFSDCNTSLVRRVNEIFADVDAMSVSYRAWMIP